MKPTHSKWRRSLLGAALLAAAAPCAAAQDGGTTAKQDGPRTVIMERVRQSGEARPMLGVLLAPDEKGGVRISGVTPGGAAEKAGMKTGDRITHIDGVAIAGKDANQRVRDARSRLRDLSADVPVRLGYVRDGKPATIEITPQTGGRRFAFVFSGEVGDDLAKAVREAGAGIDIRSDADGVLVINGERIDIPKIEIPDLTGLSERISLEIERGLDDADAAGGAVFASFSEAFRWHGLNLAAVEPKLGRYFGTDKGVLVLSAGETLAGLEAGDVILTIEGESMATPREVMAALRAKPSGSEVAIGYLRDRKTGTAKVQVPQAKAFRFPSPPPAPPASPAPPPAPPAPPVLPGEPV